MLFYMRENMAVEEDPDTIDPGLWFDIPMSDDFEVAAGLYGCHWNNEITEWKGPFPKEDGLILKVVLERRTGIKLVVSDYRTDVQILENELSDSNCDYEKWKVQWNNDIKVIYKDGYDQGIEAFKKGNL